MEFGDASAGIEERAMTAVTTQPSSTGSVVRVLIVEDFLPFRRFICSTLGERPDLRVIAEVSDGLGAVQKSGRIKAGLDFTGYRSPNVGWNQGRSTSSQTLSRIKNSLLESGIFC